MTARIRQHRPILPQQEMFDCTHLECARWQKVQERRSKNANKRKNISQIYGRSAGDVEDGRGNYKTRY
jgi:hypothetical protein